MSAPSGLSALARPERLALAAACAGLLALVLGAPAAAATKVDDTYRVTLAPGAGTADELRVAVPDAQSDPDVDWQVEVTARDGGAGCQAFGLAVVGPDGTPGQALAGVGVVDGRLPVAVQVAAAGDGGPLDAGGYRCGLHLARQDFTKDVEVRLEVVAAQVTTTVPAPAPPTTTTAAPVTTRPAATTTTSTEAPTTSSATTTTQAVAAAPAAAPGAGAGGGGGGPALGGKAPVIGAMLAVALALLLLGGGMLATSGRSARRLPRPLTGPPGTRQGPPSAGGPGGFRPAGRPGP